MASILQKARLHDHHLVAELNKAIMLGLVCSGLVACMLGASVYDVGRWFSAW